MNWRLWRVSKLIFAEDAWEEYLYWQMEDRRILKRINALLKEIQRSPFEGTGKPEPLKGEYKRAWSRRINEKDRLVYEVMEEAILIIQCKGHYGDK